MTDETVTESIIKVMVEAVQADAVIKTRLENIADGLRAQDIKLDGLLKELTEMRIEQRGFRQDIEGIKSTVADHEARLRTQSDRLNGLNAQMTRLFAYGAAALIIIQAVVSIFVAPWIQKLLF